MSSVTRGQDAEGKAANQNTRQRSSAASQGPRQGSTASQSTRHRSSANQSTRQASTPSTGLPASDETGSNKEAPSEEVKGHPVSKDGVKPSEPALPIVEVVFYIVCIIGIMFKANILSVYQKSNGMFVTSWIFVQFCLILFVLLFQRRNCAICMFLCIKWAIKGELHPKLKFSMFWALSQNYQYFFGKIISKLSEKLKNVIKILIDQMVLELLI